MYDFRVFSVYIPFVIKQHFHSMLEEDLSVSIYASTSLAYCTSTLFTVLFSKCPVDQ